MILDFLLNTPATAQAWESRQAFAWDGGTLCVVPPTGLIQLEELRGSGKDRDDIAYLKGILDED